VRSTTPTTYRPTIRRRAGLLLGLVAAIAICRLLAILIDTGALVAVLDRFAAVVAMQNVIAVNLGLEQWRRIGSA